MKRVKDCLTNSCQGCWHFLTSRRRKRDGLLGEEKCILEEPLPYVVTTHCVVNGQHHKKSVNSKNVPFAIPVRKTTPAMDTLQVSDDGSSTPTIRSRSSTIEAAIGELDLTLYTGYDSDDSSIYPHNHLGRLWYTLYYNSTQEQLQVTLGKAKHLPTDFNADLAKDCSIRVCLMPDEKRYSETTIKHEETNPVFNESFTFSLPSAHIYERYLYFTLNQSPQTKKWEPSGHAVVQLDETLFDEIDEDEEHRKRYWFDFTSRKISQQVTKHYHKGKALISLRYDRPKQRVFIALFKCIELEKTEQPVEVSLKVELLTMNKKVKKKKGITVTQEGDMADFNEIFKFALTEDKLPQSSISVTIKQLHTGKDDPGGRTVLGGFMLASGRELDHWQSMIENPNDQHIQWHFLS